MAVKKRVTISGKPGGIRVTKAGKLNEKVISSPLIRKQIKLNERAAQIKADLAFIHASKTLRTKKKSIEKYTKALPSIISNIVSAENLRLKTVVNLRLKTALKERVKHLIKLKKDKKMLKKYAEEIYKYKDKELFLESKGKDILMKKLVKEDSGPKNQKFEKRGGLALAPLTLTATAFGSIWKMAGESEQKKYLKKELSEIRKKLTVLNKKPSKSKYSEKKFKEMMRKGKI